MQKFLTNALMRQCDSYTINTLGVPSIELMERAGAALAEQVQNCGDKCVTVVCGGGNNGGDGYVCARLLMERGVAVSVCDLSGGRYSPDCADRKGAYGGQYASTIKGDIIVDCIFGTGLCRNVEGEYAAAIDAINASGAFVVSADIPSGINGDNGRVMGTAVRADITVAIAQYKLGHVLGDGPDYCGAVIRADIGIDAPADCACAFEDGDISPFFPKRLHNSHKGNYGSACIVAGSKKYPGAAALCLSMAERSGCGYVKLCSDSEVKSALVATYPQAIYLERPDYSCSALAVGPGCGDDQATYNAVKDALLNYEGKLIIDADGLNSLSHFGKEILRDKKCSVLITPHVKEFSRLTGKAVDEILNDPVNCAKAFAGEYGVTVLLKGAATIITDGQRVALNLRGSTALAKGGSGDMLTGFICGTAARGLNLFNAAVCASYVMGAAAEEASAQRTDYCATAQDIIERLPEAIKNIVGG